MSAFVNALYTPLLIFHTAMDASLLGGNTSCTQCISLQGPVLGGREWRREGDSLLLLSEVFKVPENTHECKKLSNLCITSLSA